MEKESRGSLEEGLPTNGNQLEKQEEWPGQARPGGLEDGRAGPVFPE